MTKTQLRQIREKMGLSQSQLAELLNVTQSAVSRWENGFRRIAGPAAALLEVLKRDFKNSNPERAVLPDGTIVYRLGGNFHREDGPAIQRPSGESSFYIHGQLIQKTYISDGESVKGGCPETEAILEKMQWFYNDK